jgi:hypothetical protein
MDLDQKVVIYLQCSKLNRAVLRKINTILSQYTHKTVILDNTPQDSLKFLEEHANVRVINVKHLVGHDFIEEVDDCCLKLSQVITNFDVSYLTYGGIHLGNIIDNPLYGRYFDILEDLFIIDKVIASEKPNRFIKYSGFSLYSKEMTDLLRAKYKIRIDIKGVDSIKRFYMGVRRTLVGLVNVLSLFFDLYLLRDMLKYLAHHPGKDARWRESERDQRSPRQGEGEGEVGGDTRPLFVIDNPNSSCVETVLPLIRRFGRAGVITHSLEVVKLRSGFNYEKLVYLPLYRRFVSGRRLRYIFDRREFGRRLSKHCVEIKGYDFSPFLRKDLSTLFFKDFPRIVSSIDALEKVLKAGLYNILVLPSDSRELEEECVRVAPQFNIPTLVVQHGIGGRRFGHIPVNATRVALWGERDRLWFERNGADMSKVMVIGCPRFDELIHCSFERRAILSKYGLPDTRIILVATTQMIAEYFRDDTLIFRVLMLLGTCKNLLFLVVPHPSENANRYEAMLREVNAKNGRVLRGAALNELIFVSQLVITFPSTVPLHAMLLRKPLVLLYRNTVYSEYPELVNITQETEVSALLAPLLSDKCFASPPNYAPIVRHFLGEWDGRATERAMALISRMRQGGQDAVRCLGDC